MIMSRLITKRKKALQLFDVTSIRYGSKVQIVDDSALDGNAGVVVNVKDEQLADVLVDKEIIWTVRLEELNLIL